MSADRRVDRKGRVTLPKEFRDRLGIDADSEVTVDLDDGEIVIRPAVSREHAVDHLEGCIDETRRRSDPPEPDPTRLKADWTSDLPS